MSAARVYLNMRGFSVVEQGWSLGRNKIDVIAKKQGTVYFIDIKYHPKGQITSEPSVTQTFLDKRRRAAEAWVYENKWASQPRFASLELSGPSFTVLGFSEELI